MDFVVESLVDFIGYTVESATELTVSIHELGSAIETVPPYEIAEQKGVEVTDSARKQQYPLQVKLEPDAE
jgi:ATP-dependent Clp protease adapter protein ClpS